MWNERKTAIFRAIITEEEENGLVGHIKTVKIEVENPWRFDPYRVAEELEEKFTNGRTKYVRVKFVGWEDGKG